MYIIGQILTLLSYLVFWISRFEKTKKKMLLGDNISRIIAILAFLSLKTYDGLKNTIYVIFRNILGEKAKEKQTKIIALVIMLLILVFMYTIDFNGISTICIGICGILNLYGTIMGDEQEIRIFGMIGSGFYTMFMLFTSNIMGVICEIICFVAMLVSYKKYKKIIKSK